MEKLFLMLISCSGLLCSRLASRTAILAVPDPFIVDVGQEEAGAPCPSAHNAKSAKIKDI